MMNARLFSAVAVACALTATSCGKMKKPSAPEYSGRHMGSEIGVLRDKQNKAAAFVAERDMDWELYAGPSVDAIDLSKPIARGEAAGTYALDIPAGTRSYFQAVTGRGNAILAETHLPMEGGYNFRDMGGIRTVDGRYVKWGKVIRSDDMNNLTQADLDYLASIPLTSVVDLRSTGEIEAAPDKLPSSVTGHYLYSITPGNISNFSSWTDAASILNMPNVMREMNELLVSDPDAIDQYRKLFALLQDEEKLPLLFHCSAGKDRTGMGAALFLLALGVDKGRVLENYLDSNIYLGDKYAALVKQDPQLRAMTEVRSEYLQAGLDRINRDYGSVEAFLTTALGVDLEKMKEIYLY